MPVIQAVHTAHMLSHACNPSTQRRLMVIIGYRAAPRLMGYQRLHLRKQIVLKTRSSHIPCPSTLGTVPTEVILQLVEMGQRKCTLMGSLLTVKRGIFFPL